jgi:hypothetical protein
VAEGGIQRRGAAALVRLRVGRVIEVRLGRLADLADVESLNADVSAAVRRAGPGAVICADYRAASPVSGGVASAWSDAMRRTNRAIARSAVLVDPSNAMFNLQMERIVRCAVNPARRLFADMEDLRDWMDGDLTEPEREALAAFLLCDD